MATRVGVTGAEGQIGSRLVKTYWAEPLFCNVTVAEEVRKELHRVNPDVVLHLAAQTSVDWCQEHYEEAVAVNVYGTSVVCQIAEETIGKGRVALISSDMVFDGKEGNYDESAEPNPINYYGLSKFAAEGIAQIYNDKIIRISRCFDSNSKDICRYLDKLEKKEEIHVPSHFYRSYCHLDFVAKAMLEYANRFMEMPEILHLGGMRSYSFFELVAGIADEFGLDIDLIYPRGEEAGHTPRPFKTGLNTSLAASLGLPVYRVSESVRKMKNEDK